MAVTFTHWGVVGVVLAASGVPLLVRVVNTAYLFLREKPWLMPDAATSTRPCFARCSSRASAS